MTDHPSQREVETLLRRRGTELRAALVGVDLTPAVLDRVGPIVVAPRPARTRRWVVIAMALVAVAIATAWAASALIFDGGPITVREGRPPSRTSGANLSLGHPVGLSQARELPASIILDVPSLQRVATRWVDPRVPDQFSLTVPSSRRLPEIGSSGIGLVIQSFAGDGHEVIRKFLTNGSRARRIEVNGVDAVFLDGGDHALFYLRPDGTYARSRARAVGHALIFRLGPLTVRIEGHLPMHKMVSLARSVRANEQSVS